MWVFDRVKAIRCPAAVCNLDREYFQQDLRCEMGCNGHKKINVAMKKMLSVGPHIELGE